MNKHINLYIGTFLATPLLVTGVVGAQGNGQMRPNTTTQAPVSTAQTDRPAAEAKTTLQQRIDKRKSEMKLKLSNAEKQRLVARCKNSQGSLKSLNGRITGIETSRQQVHDNLISRLTALSQKLEARNLDVADFNLQVAALQERITTFQADLGTYKQAVSDLGVMECAKDPEAFKASLEAARAAREKVKMDAIGIRNYLNENIKPTLKKVRDQVAAAQAEGGNQ